MAKVINVEYGGTTYPITIDAPTEEEVSKNPGLFTIVNGKHYRIDGPKQLISQQKSRLQVSSDASNTSAAAAVATMNASTRTSSLLPSASVSGSPILSIKNRIESRLEKPPKPPIRGTPPTMNRINEVNNSPNAIVREEAKEEKEKEEKDIQKVMQNMQKPIKQKRSSMQLFKPHKKY